MCCRDHARRRERQGDAQEAAHRAVAEVGRGLERAAVELLERGVDRQDGERRPGMGQGHDHGTAVVEPPGQGLGDQAGADQAGVEHPAIAEDDLPGEDAQQVAGPERDGDQEQPQGLAAAAIERDVVGDGISKKDGDGRDHGREPQGAEQQGAVERVGPGLPVVVERQRAVEREVVLGPKTQDQDGGDRDRQEQEGVEEGRGDQEPAGRLLAAQPGGPGGLAAADPGLRGVQRHPLPRIRRRHSAAPACQECRPSRAIVQAPSARSASLRSSSVPAAGGRSRSRTGISRRRWSW